VQPRVLQSMMQQDIIKYKMKIQQETHIHNSIEEVYKFLMDVNNYSAVLPKETHDFHTVDDKTFVLRINKHVTLRPLTISSSIENKQVVYTSEDFLDMTVTIDLIETDKKKSKAILNLEITNMPAIGKLFGDKYARKFLKELAKTVRKIK
jgi:carbon monoxide dehydrogenase subunit G